MLTEPLSPHRSPLVAVFNNVPPEEVRSRVADMTAAQLREVQQFFAAMEQAWRAVMRIQGVPVGVPPVAEDVVVAGLDAVRDLVTAAEAREQAQQEAEDAERERQEAERRREHLEHCRARAEAVRHAVEQRDAARAAAAEALARSPVGRLLAAEAKLTSEAWAFQTALQAAGGTDAQLGVLDELGDSSSAARRGLRDHPGALPRQARPDVPHGWLVDLVAQLPMLLEANRQLQARVARLEAGVR